MKIPVTVPLLPKAVDRNRHLLPSEAFTWFAQGWHDPNDPQNLNSLRPIPVGFDYNTGIASLDVIGADNVMIETDYPHSDSTWPNSIEYAHKQLAGLDNETKYKILRGNAERLYRFTPAEAAGPARG